VLTVTQNSNPKTKTRDITIGFTCGGLSYTVVGLIGYIAYGKRI